MTRVDGVVYMMSSSRAEPMETVPIEKGYLGNKVIMDTALQSDTPQNGAYLILVSVNRTNTWGLQ